VEIKPQVKQKQAMSEEETGPGTGPLRHQTDMYLLLVSVGKHLGR